jgi:hypothetical protein
MRPLGQLGIIRSGDLHVAPSGGKFSGLGMPILNANGALNIWLIDALRNSLILVGLI